MKNITGTIAAVAVALFTSQAQAAVQTPGQKTYETSMTEYDKTRPPMGYVQFCKAHPADCRPALPQSMTLTKARWEELNAINTRVNRAIAPVTDAELYKVEENWTYPVNQGDCEDYVLLKRRMLIENGWSAANLLITVVRDQYGDGHAVLTVRTEQGDLILDNVVDDIRYWSDTGYRYEKRQSASNPTAWVWLRGDRSRSQILSAIRGN